MQKNDPFQTEAYRQIQREHLYRTIAFLLEEGIEFAVAAEVEHLEFDPPLPEEVAERMAPLSLFVLSNYTFESGSVDEEALSFEAGFGPENFGAWVRVPLLAIKQVIVGEYPIAINIAEPSALETPEASHSMEALLSNPENRKLLKKKK